MVVIIYTVGKVPTEPDEETGTLQEMGMKRFILMVAVLAAALSFNAQAFGSCGNGCGHHRHHRQHHLHFRHAGFAQSSCNAGCNSGCNKVGVQRVVVNNVVVNPTPTVVAPSKMPTPAK